MIKLTFESTCLQFHHGCAFWGNLLSIT